MYIFISSLSYVSHKISVDLLVAVLQLLPFCFDKQNTNFQNLIFVFLIEISNLSNCSLESWTHRVKYWSFWSIREKRKSLMSSVGGPSPVSQSAGMTYASRASPQVKRLAPSFRSSGTRGRKAAIRWTKRNSWPLSIHPDTRLQMYCTCSASTR